MKKSTKAYLESFQKDKFKDLLTLEDLTDFKNDNVSGIALSGINNIAKIALESIRRITDISKKFIECNCDSLITEDVQFALDRLKTLTEISDVTFLFQQHKIKFPSGFLNDEIHTINIDGMMRLKTCLVKGTPNIAKFSIEDLFSRLPIESAPFDLSNLFKSKKQAKSKPDDDFLITLREPPENRINGGIVNLDSGLTELQINICVNSTFFSDQGWDAINIDIDEKGFWNFRDAVMYIDTGEITVNGGSIPGFTVSILSGLKEDEQKKVIDELESMLVIASNDTFEKVWNDLDTKISNLSDKATGPFEKAALAQASKDLAQAELDPGPAKSKKREKAAKLVASGIERLGVLKDILVIGVLLELGQDALIPLPGVIGLGKLAIKVGKGLTKSKAMKSALEGLEKIYDGIDTLESEKAKIEKLIEANDSIEKFEEDAIKEIPK